MLSDDLVPCLGLGPNFSRESLLVPPLQPSQKNKTETPDLRKYPSRGLTHVRSPSSISSIVNEEPFPLLQTEYTWACGQSSLGGQLSKLPPQLWCKQQSLGLDSAINKEDSTVDAYIRQ